MQIPVRWRAMLSVAALAAAVLAQPARAQWMGVRSANDWIDVAVGFGNAESDGYWSVGAAEGDPSTAADDGKAILDVFSNPGFRNTLRQGSFSTFLVDPPAGDPLVALGTNLHQYGINTDATITPPAVLADGSVRSIWRWTPNVAAPQVPFTGPLQITRTFTLIHDVVRVEYDILNQDSRSHNVGMSGFFDPSQPLVALGDRGRIRQETILTGRTRTPSQVEWLDPAIAPAAIDRLSLKGGDMTIQPDKLVVGEYLNLQAVNWAYTPAPAGVDVVNPALGVWYNPSSIGPGAHRAIVFYVGLGTSSQPLQRPGNFTVAGTSPRLLRASATPTGGKNGLENNPFTVTAYVANRASAPVTGSLTITLPSGLSLAPGEVATKPFSRLPATLGKPVETSVSWSVVASGTNPGISTYTVVANTSPFGTKSFSRQIGLAGTTTVRIDNSYRMMTFPFNFVDPRPSRALRSSPTSVIRVLRFDPATGLYAQPSALQPGEAYWVKTESTTPVTLQMVNASPQAPIEIVYPLSNAATGSGFNLVGSPYTDAIVLGSIRVGNNAHPDLGIISMAEAMDRGWIDRTTFGWDPSAGIYTTVTGPARILEPESGIWLRAIQPVYLVFDPADVLAVPIQ
jgi:hypothetical protein